MSEQSLLKKFLIEFSRMGGRLFRNNTGMAYAGKAKRLADGAVLIAQARPLRAGLCVGSSDLIGWQTISITPDFVGRQVAVFTAIEVKSSMRLRPTTEQRAFLDAVSRAGGIAIVAHELNDILKGVGGYVGAVSKENLPES